MALTKTRLLKHDFPVHGISGFFYSVARQSNVNPKRPPRCPYRNRTLCLPPWFLLGEGSCREAARDWYQVREQKRHIRKNHINFLKADWTAGSVGFLKFMCLFLSSQVQFFRRILGHSWSLVYGEGFAPGTVPPHNLRVTSHVLHQDVLLGCERKKHINV